MYRPSIREKLIFWFLLLGICAIGVISLNFYFKTRNALINRTYEQLTSLRMVKKKRIETFFTDRIREARLLSHTTDIIAMVEKLGSSTTENGISDINQIYNSSLSSFFATSDFYSLVIAGRNGAGLELLPDKQTEMFAKPLNNNLSKLTTLISSKNDLKLFDFNFLPDSLGKFMYIVSSVENKDGYVIGFIVLKINNIPFNRIMLETNPHNGMGETGESFIVGNDYLMRSNSRFTENSALKTVVKNKAVESALAGQDGVIEMNDYRNKRVLNSHDKIRIDFPWVIMTEIDYNEAMIPIFELRKQIILISIFIFFVLFILVYFLAGKITKPLVSLREAVNKVSNGEFNIRIKAQTHDEIGDLTEAFNNMTLKIKQQNDELVQEKSKQMISFIDGQEMERQRLSRELHDGLGQSLVAIRMRLESITHVDMSKIRYVLTIVKELFDRTIDDIRRMSNDLMPVVLNDFGLETAIRTLCENIESSAGVDVIFTAENIPEKLSKKAMTYIYRIIQESLNNMAKHSCATKAEVKLSISGELLNLLITDNGLGFNVNTAHSGNGSGLYNIHERVSLLQGSIRMNSAPEKGTTITIAFPLSKIIDL